MKKPQLLCCVALALTLGFVLVPGRICSGAETLTIQKAYGRLPLHFEANRGQADKRVDFLARGPGYGLFLVSGEAVFRLKSATKAATLRMKVVGADGCAKAEELDELPGKVNYFI
ncbi:MAG: hypothetical protein ABR589_12410, partial [Chthoniobacterales bacterium]